MWLGESDRFTLVQPVGKVFLKSGVSNSLSESEFDLSVDNLHPNPDTLNEQV